MGGLLNTLEIASSSLLASRAGLETAGVNISNVNNPGFARQRIIVEPRKDPTGAGAGVEVVGVKSLRDAILDDQLIRESSNMSYLQNLQRTLQIGQVLVGQQIDRQTATPEADSAARNLGGQMAIANGLSEFYNALQAVSVNPGSTVDRRVLLLKAQQLAEKFNAVQQRFETMRKDLGSDIENRVDQANKLIELTARVGRDYTALSEKGAGVLKDTLQTRLEELAGFASVQVSYDELNRMSLSISGMEVIHENKAVGNLKVILDDKGQTTVSVTNSDTGAETRLAGQGSLRGLIDARDTAIRDLQDGIDQLATNLMQGMNATHKAGFGLDGSTGLDFFTGRGASDIAVNKSLVDDVRKIQLSESTAQGDNTVALNLVNWLESPQADLGKLTLSQRYNDIVATYGQELSNVNNRLSDQDIINHTLTQQRASVSGVSLDEEMSSMIQYQRAYQSTAKLISTIDELFQTMLTM